MFYSFEPKRFNQPTVDLIYALPDRSTHDLFTVLHIEKAFE